MNESKKTFRTFEDLEMYKSARAFRRAMYGVARKLPDFEKYGLASQIRRASVSITNNIAEGHGRYHYLDQVKFALQARGSLEELIDDLNVCDDEHYLTADEVGTLKEDAWKVQRLINGYIRFLRNQQTASINLRESSPAEMNDELDSTILQELTL